MINREQMNIVIVGHVDHGKSTVIGRLLADTNSLPDGKLERVKEYCANNSKPFEYAFLLDALKDEQAQGITIDSARCFFKSKKRDYILIDAPGHIEFLKNMVSGAARAEAAVLVIDANEGIKENSKRHGYLLSMLGISNVIIVMNKMDLVNYSEQRFNDLVLEYTSFLKAINISPKEFIPVSGLDGENIIEKSDSLGWFGGNTLLSALDSFDKMSSNENKQFRMPIQDVYKFTEDGDDRRLIVGKIESGNISIGDKIIFLPSNKISSIASIELFNSEKKRTVHSGESTAFCLNEQVYVERGQVMCKLDESCEASSKIKTILFWMGNQPLVTNKTYFLKIGTEKVKARVEKFLRVMDASKLSAMEKDTVERHDVVECVIDLNSAIAFDLINNIPQMGRFVIVDDYEISGGGIIKEVLDDTLRDVRDNVALREEKWYSSKINFNERSEKYNQKPSLILITGRKDLEKKEIARIIERKLFDAGNKIYFLGIGNLLRGLDQDVVKVAGEEHMRRLGEVSNLMVHAGLIVVATAGDLTEREIKLLKVIMNEENVFVAGFDKIGDEVDFVISENHSDEKNADYLINFLRKTGVIR
jgi:bifunctional enzyme CysN/CysC